MQEVNFEGQLKKNILAKNFFLSRIVLLILPQPGTSRLGIEPVYLALGTYKGSNQTYQEIVIL